MAFGFSLNA